MAVVRLPRISNFTDVDALGLEPDLDMVFASTPRALTDADLVVLPGTRSTIADLGWLRSRGLDRALLEHAASGRPVLGVCGGARMLGREIADPAGVEGPPTTVAGLGLLDLTTTFTPAKVLRTHSPAGARSITAGGRRAGERPGDRDHGARRARGRRSPARYLADTLGVVSRASFSCARERRLDTLGDLVEEHLECRRTVATRRGRVSAEGAVVGRHGRRGDLGDDGVPWTGAALLSS